MEHTLINVLIVDDEDIVREGLKHIIDWQSLGFMICDEASDGQEAIEKIQRYNPGLVLLDIRMPRMYGTELIQHVRENGFTGDFIVLSGYSDFKYAQTALHYGVSYYLTKPIDEEELEEAARAVREKIEKRETRESSLHQYLKKAKSTVLFDLLTHQEFDESINYMELGLSAPIYQVIIYEGYTPFFSSYSFAELLKVNNHGNDSFEHILLNSQDVIILKGTFALERFSSVLAHYKEGTQKGSPLDSIFLAYGRTVPRISDIRQSYEECLQLMDRRFFCEENQHVLSYEDLPTAQALPESVLAPAHSREISQHLVNYIQTYNRRMISQTLTQLKTELYESQGEVINIKHFLADIFLEIKQAISHTYEQVSFPFAHNAAIIELIENKYYLYEILLYFTEQFEVIIRAIGSNSSSSVFDDILYYIEHNYGTSLKLETIAPLFGYNSAYLGKLFSQKMSQSFNSYLDQVRIDHSKDLLIHTDWKVYEIAAKTGYKNVDYFHQKFKKQTGVSPAEYRRANTDS